jgi:UDP-N-acetylmuramate dehydrogenase
MLDAADIQWLRRKFGAGVRFNEPMAAYTSFKIGGPADVFVQPESEDKLKAIVKWSHEKKISYVLVGAGTNMLVKDGGIRGLVIHLGKLVSDVTWDIRQARVKVSTAAGIPTKRICALALKQGWRGMNFALGIPGTIGGAIMMNAGTAHGAMADVIDSVAVITGKGEKVVVRRESMHFKYRSLQLPASITAGGSASAILTAADLNLVRDDRRKIRRQARQWMQLRSRHQPTWQPSAGCFFRNPQSQLVAGRLIEEAGLKGWQFGKARISSRHANFIINLGGASAADVLAVKTKIQETVRSRFGINLEPEVHIVGEEKNNA